MKYRRHRTGPSIPRLCFECLNVGCIAVLPLWVITPHCPSSARVLTLWVLCSAYALDAYPSIPRKRFGCLKGFTKIMGGPGRLLSTSWTTKRGQRSEISQHILKTGTIWRMSPSCAYPAKEVGKGQPHLEHVLQKGRPHVVHVIQMKAGSRLASSWACPTKRTASSCARPTNEGKEQSGLILCTPQKEN